MEGLSVYESDNFIVKARQKPHIDRDDGGHLTIYPKEYFCDRTQLNGKLAIELSRITMLIGESFVLGMKKIGVDIVRINYQDNGNRAFKYNKKPSLHIHLYGRVEDEKLQNFPEALVLPPKEDEYYSKLKPLNQEDVESIKEEIQKFLKSEKYNKSNWSI